MKTQSAPIVLFVNEKDLASVVQNATSQGRGSCTLQASNGSPSRLIVSQPVRLEYVVIGDGAIGTVGAKGAEV